MKIDILLVLIFFVLRLPVSSVVINSSTVMFLYRFTADFLIMMSILLLLRRRGALSQQIYGWNVPKVSDILRGAILSIILYLLSLSIFQIFREQYTMLALSFRFGIYGLLLLGACVEELFYRGFLLKRILQFHVSPFLAIIISSILFAMGHWGAGTGGLVFSSIAGFFLGVSMFVYKSITLCILAHFLYNSILYTIGQLSQ